MATKRKNKQTVVTSTETLPKGVKLLPNGQYRATAGTSNLRQQLNFDTAADAIDWKRSADRHLKAHNQKLSKEAWRATEPPIRQTPAGQPVIVPISVGDFIEEAAKVLAEGYRDGGSVRSNAR